jgi:hypothetical protein
MAALCRGAATVGSRKLRRFKAGQGRPKQKNITFLVMSEGSTLKSDKPSLPEVPFLGLVKHPIFSVTLLDLLAQISIIRSPAIPLLSP